MKRLIYEFHKIAHCFNVLWKFIRTIRKIFHQAKSYWTLSQKHFLHYIIMKFYKHPCLQQKYRSQLTQNMPWYNSLYCVFNPFSRHIRRSIHHFLQMSSDKWCSIKYANINVCFLVRYKSIVFSVFVSKVNNSLSEFYW